MGVIAEGIPRGCQGLSTPVSLGYPLSVFNKNSTLKQTCTPTQDLQFENIVCLSGCHKDSDSFMLQSCNHQLCGGSGSRIGL